MKKTSEFYVELSKLIKTIPAPASVVFDVMTYKRRVRITRLHCSMLEKSYPIMQLMRNGNLSLEKALWMMKSFCNAKTIWMITWKN